MPLHALHQPDKKAAANGAAAPPTADPSSAAAVPTVTMINDGSVVRGPPRGPPDASRPVASSASLPLTVSLDADAIARCKNGRACIATLHVVSWTSSAAFGKGYWKADTNGGGSSVILDVSRGDPNALPGDVVLIQLDDPSRWMPPGSEAGGQQQRDDAGEAAANWLEAAPQVEGELLLADGDDKRLPDGREIVHAIKVNPDESIAVRRMRSTLAGRVALSVGAPVSPPTDCRWPSGLQPRGFIEKVVKRNFERMHACRFFAPPTTDPSKKSGPLQLERFHRFKPYDVAFPIIAVFGRDVPSNLRDTPEDYLYMVEIQEHRDRLGEPVMIDGRFPLGIVKQSLGRKETAEAESTAIASAFKVKSAPFTEEVEACVMNEFVIPDPDELQRLRRRDLRDEEFVCTIDPPTARDLDDAISIEATSGGYRVGVHIADVSYFVPYGSPLDEEASERATSVYFIERVIPMLPHKLCEDYCSLNAGTDKFAFSGIWHFDRSGKVQSEWFGQSVIRNRCRMTYDDAQRIIDGDLSGNSLQFKNETASREALVARVVQSVQLMWKLAQILKENRRNRGAIALNKAKLQFTFDTADSKLAPSGFRVERTKEANWLVEEFMLHANFRVAEKVFEFLPDSALLRKHDAPRRSKLQQLGEIARKCGFDIRATSSKALADSLERLSDHPDIDALRTMTTMCMSLAKYVCTGDHDASSEDPKQQEKDPKAAIAEATSTTSLCSTFRHYALAAYAYCHFTSPIRRYADLVTHRQLLLALDIEREVKRNKGRLDALPEEVDLNNLPHGEFYMDPSDVSRIATHCNEKKELARKAGDASAKLFLCLYLESLRLKSAQDPRVPATVVTTAVVVRVKANGFSLSVSRMGIDCEILHNTKSQLWKDENETEEGGAGGFTINWGQDPKNGSVVKEKANLFSRFVVTIRVVVKGYLQVDFLVHPPWDRSDSVLTVLPERL